MSRRQGYQAGMAALAATALAAALALTGCASVDFTPPPANPAASNLGLDASATAAASAAASANPDASGTPAGSSVPAPSGSPTASVAVPGPNLSGSKPEMKVNMGGMGSVRGTLLFKDAGGGTWIIVNSLPGVQADNADPFVSIANADQFPLKSMKDKYVQASGSVSPTSTGAVPGPVLNLTAITLTQ